MHPQLDAIVREFESARERLRALQAVVPPERLGARPGPERWSAAECVAHLNLTSSATIPLLREGIERARLLPAAEPQARFRRDLFGWLIWKAQAPGKYKVATKAAFVPGAATPVRDLVAEFERLHDEQIGLVRAADRLPLDRVRIVSPFDARVRYNLYAAFSILARHQHRHLRQAEEAAALPTG